MILVVSMCVFVFTVIGALGVERVIQRFEEEA